MDNDLVCNYKKCRKRLNTFAWVTSCSHIFCDEDGTREFNKSFTCPACETNLSNKFDIIRIDIQPNEQYKSMVLAGQKPETIMEICSRAQAFWTYQSHQERTYQEYVATKSKEKISQLEHYYEQIITQTQTEINTLKTNLTASKKELDALKKRYNEVSEKMLEKNRQYQKLQTMYDGLRRKCINPSSLDGEPVVTHSHRHGQGFYSDMIMTTGDDLLRRRGPGGAGDAGHAPLRVSRAPSPAEREFVLRPNSTPVVHPNNRERGGMSLQHRFNMQLGTPDGSRK